MDFTYPNRHFYDNVTEGSRVQAEPAVSRRRPGDQGRMPEGSGVTII
jgi:hypothetical protein